MFFIVKHGGHVHVSDIWVVGEIISKRAVMRRKKC